MSAAVALLIVTAARAEAEERGARYYFEEAMKAYDREDYDAYLANLLAADSIRPHHPTILYRIAGANALLGNVTEAIELLSGIADMGLIYSPGDDESFASLRDSYEFIQLYHRFEDNARPHGTSSIAFTLGEKGLITEGISYDAREETFYVSSIHKRKILRIARDGTVDDFSNPADSLWSVLGMRVDVTRRTLWATAAAFPGMINFTEADRGRAGVFRYDLDTGRLVRRYLLLDTGTGGHSIGDITVSPAGDAYVSDSQARALYVIYRGEDRLVPFLEGEPFKSPQGLDFSRDGKLLYVADYAEGVFAVDVASREVKKLPVPGRIALLGIDGLYVHGGHLIAIQNGINPHRVVRILLGADGEQVTGMEVLEANNPLFDEPTLGVVVDDLFYYIANSQWTAFDEEGNLAPLEELHEHVILKTKL